MKFEKELSNVNPIERKEFQIVEGDIRDAVLADYRPLRDKQFRKDEHPATPVNAETDN